MRLSYCVDDEERIISLCMDDLSGCSDWAYGDIGLKMDDALYDIHGAALYKLVNGIAVARSETERSKDWIIPTDEESESEKAAMRMADIEDAIVELAELYAEQDDALVELAGLIEGGE